MTGANDRLHAIDLVWLEMEGDGPPIAIGTVAVAAGPPPDDGEVLRLLADRLPRMPGLRQLLAPDGAGLRRPTRLRAEHLDLPAYVHRVEAATTASRGGLDAVVGGIMETTLPRDRPRWDAWVVEGLDGRWALVWRVHHTITDGLGALALLGHGFDLAPDGGTTLAEAVLGHAEQRATPVQSAGGGVGVGQVLGAVGSAVPHVGPALAALVPHPPSALAAAVGSGRTWSSVDVPLPEVKAAGRAFGATVNDVILAAVAGGFRDLLRHRGEPLRGRVVRNLVPVSMRPSGDGRSINEVSALLGHLPVGIDDPVARLHAVTAEVDHGKQARTPVLGSLLLSLVDHTVPAFVQDAAVAAAGQWAPSWFFDTLTTNVPGPQFPVYLCGRRVTAMYPIIPVAGHTAITTGIFSYDGALNIGVTGDTDHAGDVAVLAGGIRRAVAELADLARRPGPRRSAPLLAHRDATCTACSQAPPSA